MSKLYDSGDYKNLKFEYVGPTKEVDFYEYKNSKEQNSKEQVKQLLLYQILALITHGKI